MLFAQKRKSRKIKTIDRVDNALILHSEYGILKISPKNDYIIRITFTCKSDINSDTCLGIINDETYFDWTYYETDTFVFMKTSSLMIEISKETASLRYFNHNGELLLSERVSDSKVLSEFDSYKIVVDENTEVGTINTADGVKQTISKATKVIDKKLYHTHLFLDFQENEALFGLGQGEEGTLNLRGTTQYLHQANLKIAIPFLLSTKGYGILLGTDSPVIFNDTEYGTYLYSEAALQLDYYFIAGDNFDDIIKGYRKLSGKAVMLPKWTFGYIQCQERYETADELIDTVKEYRNRNIGLDCIVLDWMSWPDNMWGQKTFDTKRFPDPSKMMEQLHKMNARLMISIWPNMTKECDNYKEFSKKNLLLPSSDIYDAYNEESRRLYWEQVNRGLFTHGIDAWWCDSSEPVTPEWSLNEKPEPSTMYHEFVKEISNTIPPDKCNSFGLVHAQGIYEGQRSVTDEKRVVNLTRSGYIGGQKFGTVFWSGDTYASWETLQKQIVAGLNFCASALPYWTLDIGAFFVKTGTPWYWSGQYEDGNDDLGYRELYVRWFQYGAFLPVFRAHGTDVRREVWAFGEPGDMFYDALVKTIELRYRLIPYIYSLAGEVWHNDGTIMRMLAFDFLHDEEALTIKDQYMFGKNILVCPVTSPMFYDTGSKPIDNKEYTRTVYLPTGTRWYDFWTNDVYDGGQYINASSDLYKIPLFIKEGSILPMTTVPTNYVDEKPDAKIELRVYSGRDCEFLFYNDDGDGYMYESGNYDLIRIKWDDAAKKTSYEAINNYNKKLSKSYEDKFIVNVI